MSLEFVAILPPFMESTERAHHQTMSGEMSCTSYCFSAIYIYINAITQLLNGFVVQTGDDSLIFAV